MLETWGRRYDLAPAGRFQVTGGEPILRHDLFEILSMSASYGFDTALMTNGTLVTPEIADAIVLAGTSTVQVSLDGTRSTHDSLRGAGAYQRAVEGIRYLSDVGIPVTVNMTVSKANKADVLKLTEEAAQAGASTISFGRLMPYGRGTELADQMLEPDELKALYTEIRGLQRPDIRAVCRDPLMCALDPIDSDDPIDGDDAPAGGCAAGFSGLTVMPDGTVYPCRRLPIPIGNILRSPIRRIWAASVTLEELRNRKCFKGDCGRCGIWYRCRGCRAVAYAVSGDHLAADPQCWLQSV